MNSLLREKGYEVFPIFLVDDTSQEEAKKNPYLQNVQIVNQDEAKDSIHQFTGPGHAIEQISALILGAHAKEL